MTDIDQILWYTRQGWRVLPLHTAQNGKCSCNRNECDHVGKHPKTSHGVNDATIDEDTITKWWQTWPEANVGIATGEVSGIIVLDIDPRHGGDESLHDLAEKYEPLPETVEALTGGGGRHILFKYPGYKVKSSPNAWPGIDIRGDGTYIVAPSSTHRSGKQYVWEASSHPEDTEVASLPEWLEEVLRNGKPSENIVTPASRTEFPEGTRNDSLTSLAGSMRRKGMGEQAILAALLQENQDKCNPPLSDEEVTSIAQSVARYSPEDPMDPDPTKRFPRTDAGNAEFFAYHFGKHLRYLHRGKIWLVYRDHWWQPDFNGEVKRRAVAAMRLRHRLALDIDDKDMRSQEARHALASEHRFRLESMLSLAESQFPIADKGDGWDAAPFLLGVANGLIDLQTGNLVAGKPEDKISMHTDIVFDTSAIAPRWEQFVDEIFDSSAPLITYIQKAVGYSLTGDTKEQCLFLCYGVGANGKSTFLNTIRFLAGDYGYNTGFSTLERTNYGSASSHDIAHLDRRRLITSSETGESTKLNEARIKALTGGDEITARHLYKPEFTYRPVGKIWLGSNYKPVVQDDSYGFWRRVHLIPFLQQFTGKNEDRDLEKKLKAEAQGILTWAIKGCLAWQRDGLNPPTEVTEATQTYQEESDPLVDYLAERCEQDPSYEISAGEFYKDYHDWASGQGLDFRDTLSQTMFGRRMTQRFEKGRTAGRRMYKGVRLKDPLSSEERALFDD